ncbi:hypothetical protein C0995_004753 [Termitomyces sp. Mi166|nr:hypothetical protein C0995_004753 [Termitomyces sp. Mi166\
MTRTEAQLTDDIGKAIRDEDLDRLTLLLDEWSSLSPTSDPKFLELACATGSAPIVKLLLSHGFMIDFKAVAAAKAFTAACEPEFNFDMLQAFLDSGWDINTSFSHMGDLVIMSLSSPPPVLNWVLDHGADPNLHRDGMSHSALERAALRNYPEHAKILIAKGANVNNTNALKIAAYKGHIEMIELLLEKGANINEIPRPHYCGVTILGTALHEAAEEGQLGAVRLLLERGADPTLEDTTGKTALDLAREKNHTAIVEVLESRLSTLV